MMEGSLAQLRKKKVHRQQQKNGKTARVTILFATYEGLRQFSCSSRLPKSFNT